MRRSSARRSVGGRVAHVEHGDQPGRASPEQAEAIAPDSQWPLWEVFTQGEHGAPHEHAGVCTRRTRSRRCRMRATCTRGAAA